MEHTKQFLFKRADLRTRKERICPKCGKTKQIDEFARDQGRIDGYGYYCKECVRAAHVKMYKENPDRFKQNSNRWRLRNLQKAVAHSALHTAIKRGTISRPSVCEICNKETEVVAHHWRGYEPEFRLDVQWICRTCHNGLRATQKIQTGV